MESILSSCVFNAFFISFGCVCCSLSAFRMLFLKSSMTFTMLSWGMSAVGLGFCLPRAAIFVTCGLVWLTLVPCFTMSANFSSGTYLRLIWAFFRFLLFLLWWFFHWAFYVVRRVLGILCMMQDVRSLCSLRSRFFLCLLRLLFLSYTRLVRAAQCILHSGSLDYSFVLCGLFAGICSIAWCRYFLFFPTLFWGSLVCLFLADSQCAIGGYLNYVDWEQYIVLPWFSCRKSRHFSEVNFFYF